MCEMLRICFYRLQSIYCLFLALQIAQYGRAHLNAND